MNRALITAFSVLFLAIIAISAWQTTKLPSLAGIPSLYPPKSITGVTNPNVTQANIQSTICVSGWTATIRPPSNYTTALKLKQEQQFNLKSPQGEEEDHYISLELGGNPTDPKNLWPEAYPTAHLKDQVENYLHRQVCSGNMTLKDAQKAITTDWYKVYTTSIQGKFGSIEPQNDPDDESVDIQPSVQNY